MKTFRTQSPAPVVGAKRFQDSNFDWSTMRLTRLRGKDIP
jgi:hypothetical protein